MGGKGSHVGRKKGGLITMPFIFGKYVITVLINKWTSSSCCSSFVSTVWGVRTSLRAPQSFPSLVQSKTNHPGREVAKFWTQDVWVYRSSLLSLELPLGVSSSSLSFGRVSVSMLRNNLRLIVCFLSSKWGVWEAGGGGFRDEYDKLFDGRASHALDDGGQHSHQLRRHFQLNAAAWSLHLRCLCRTVLDYYCGFHYLSDSNYSPPPPPPPPSPLLSISV